MVSLKFYQDTLQVSTIQDLVKSFQKSLVVTNRTPEFYVNWEKVNRNVDTIKIELSLWNSLIGSENIEDDFVNLITQYPEVIKTIPILLAIRDIVFPVIIDFYNVDKGVKGLNFKKNRHSTLSNYEIEEYLDFVKKSGLFSVFSYIQNFYDYVIGVEVGMDTNARKNRSGHAMELLLQPIIEDVSRELDCKVLIQQSFSSVRLRGKVPVSLANRKSDFIVLKDGVCVNIEVNYYSGSGSKPEEIVDSYINRKNELSGYGWHFIWITDGQVWQRSESQLSKAFSELDYIFNIDFVRKGLLKKALQSIFS